MTALEADSKNCKLPAGNTRKHLKASTDLRVMDNRGFQIFFFYIYFTIIFLCFESGFFPSGFPTQTV
jgi:hypothetical protein